VSAEAEEVNLISHCIFRKVASYFCLTSELLFVAYLKCSGMEVCVGRSAAAVNNLCAMLFACGNLSMSFSSHLPHLQSCSISSGA